MKIPNRLKFLGVDHISASLVSRHIHIVHLVLFCKKKNVEQIWTSILNPFSALFPFRVQNLTQNHMPYLTTQSCVMKVQATQYVCDELLNQLTKKKRSLFNLFHVFFLSLALVCELNCPLHVMIVMTIVTPLCNLYSKLTALVFSFVPNTTLILLKYHSPHLRTVYPCCIK